MISINCDLGIFFGRFSVHFLWYSDRDDQFGPDEMNLNGFYIELCAPAGSNNYRRFPGLI